GGAAAPTARGGGAGLGGRAFLGRLPTDALELAPELVPLRLEGGELVLPDVGLALGDEIHAVVGLGPAAGALGFLLGGLELLARLGGPLPRLLGGLLRGAPLLLGLFEATRHLAQTRVHEGLGIDGLLGGAAARPRLQRAPQPARLLLEPRVLLAEQGDLLVEAPELVGARRTRLAGLARLLLGLVQLLARLAQLAAILLEFRHALAVLLRALLALAPGRRGVLLGLRQGALELLVGLGEAIARHPPGQGDEAHHADDDDRNRFHFHSTLDAFPRGSALAVLAHQVDQGSPGDPAVLAHAAGDQRALLPDGRAGRVLHSELPVARIPGFGDGRRSRRGAEADEVGQRRRQRAHARARPAEEEAPVVVEAHRARVADRRGQLDIR